MQYLSSSHRCVLLRMPFLRVDCCVHRLLREECLTAFHFFPKGPLCMFPGVCKDESPVTCTPLDNLCCKFSQLATYLLTIP